MINKKLFVFLLEPNNNFHERWAFESKDRSQLIPWNPKLENDNRRKKHL